MKKLYLIIILSIFLSPISFAQKDSNRKEFLPYISINFGIGIPLDFSLNMAHLGAENSTYGYDAEAGSSFSLHAAYPIKHHNFGVAGMLGYGINGVNLDNYRENSTISTPKNYTLLTILGGLFYRIASKSCSLEFHLLGGPLYFRTPQTTYSGDFNNYALAPGYNVDENGIWTVLSENNISFAYDAGISLQCPLPKAQKLLLLFNLDIVHSDLGKGLTTVTDFAGYYNNRPVSGTNYTWGGNFAYNEMGLVDITVGLQYQL